MEKKVVKKMSYNKVVKNIYYYCGLFAFLGGVIGIICSFFPETIYYVIFQALMTILIVVSLVFDMRPNFYKQEQSDEMSEMNLNIATRKAARIVRMNILLIAGIAYLIYIMLKWSNTNVNWGFMIFSLCYLIYGLLDFSIGIYFRKLEDE